MKNKIADEIRLKHILDAISEIEKYTKSCSLDNFIENSMIRFASVKQLEIIMSIEIGQKFSHYQIIKKPGEGGMGIVYKILDTSLNRFVTLKYLPTHLTKDESTRKRFIVED